MSVEPIKKSVFRDEPVRCGMTGTCFLIVGYDDSKRVFYTTPFFVYPDPESLRE